MPISTTQIAKDLDIHGSYNTALRNSTVGTVFGNYPDNQVARTRGRLHFGKRIMLQVIINDAPAEIATVMELLPQIEAHSNVSFGDFLHRKEAVVITGHQNRLAMSHLALQE